MLHYIIINKEWIFSGVGVFIVASAFAIARKFWPNAEHQAITVKQTQRGENDSVNIQIGNQQAPNENDFG